MVKQGSDMTKSDLDSNDVFLLDTGSNVWVWQGSRASRVEKTMWVKVAEAYVRRINGTAEAGEVHISPIAKVVDGNESQAFWKALRI
ncbi:hypothetical protein F4803DRAFT_516683 [Xylaria telfairii]|nr:hypothetical protein F4803DRAFT_516683 [Xylaria telfairii]